VVWRAPHGSPTQAQGAAAGTQEDAHV